MRTDQLSCDAAATTLPSPRSGREVLCSGNTFVITVRLDKGRVRDVWSTGKMMRDMNVLLQGSLDDRGVPQFAQQAHCLCNDGHALAAVRALEDLAGLSVPRGALLVRSLVQALRTVQAHLLHVYQFHLSDWADLNAALRADPVRTARLADRPGQDAAYFRQTRERLQTLACGQCPGLFGGGCKGHTDYRGTDETHLMLFAHAFESLQARSHLNAALGLLGYGSDGCRAYQLGGLPADMNPDACVRKQLREMLQESLRFVSLYFMPDLERLARDYAHWSGRGAIRALLSCGDYLSPGGPGRLFPGGLMRPDCAYSNGSCGWEHLPLQPDLIREEKAPLWSREDSDRYRLHFDAAGPDFRWGEEDFAWLSAPRHGRDACETGAPARVLSAWVKGAPSIHQLIRGCLDNAGLTANTMNSTLGRVFARGVEALLLAHSCPAWLNELDASFDKGGGWLRTEIKLPTSGQGTGRVEVPRGMLEHIIRMENGHIASHEYLIPSLWNFSPRDVNGIRGPLEQALLGTRVADPARPLEILRTVHELDPCNACHIVVEDGDTGRTFLSEA